MEEVFLSLGLDIIGLGVFNYDFKSITKESPVIKARTWPPSWTPHAWSNLLRSKQQGNSIMHLGVLYRHTKGLSLS